MNSVNIVYRCSQVVVLFSMYFHQYNSKHATLVIAHTPNISTSDDRSFAVLTSIFRRYIINAAALFKNYREMNNFISLLCGLLTKLYIIASVAAANETSQQPTSVSQSNILKQQKYINVVDLMRISIYSLLWYSSDIFVPYSTIYVSIMKQ